MDADLAGYFERREAALGRVRALIVEKLDVRCEPDDIDADTPLFGTGLGLDSIDAVELVVSVEKEFGVKVPSEAAGRRALRTPNALVDLVLAAAAEGAVSTPPAAPSAGSAEDPLDPEIRAIRERVALSLADHVAVVRVEGEGAFAAVDRLLASDLMLQDSQLRLSLVLGDDGAPIADVTVGRDDDAYLLLVEGMSARDVVDRVRAAAADPAAIEARDLGETHAIVSLHGPWAWELLGELLGPELVGMPYMSLVHVGAITVLRSGKTGEYGYDLIVPHADRGALIERVERLGAAFDLGRASLAALDQCALESRFFNIRREGAFGLGAVELGLGWRLSRRKETAAARAIREAAAAGGARRLVTAIAARPVAVGSRVRLGDRVVGVTVNAGRSPVLDAPVVLLALERGFAYPGVDRYRAEDQGDRVALRTLAPPLLDNRSLHVSPMRHAYAAREEEPFPPLVPPPPGAA